MWIDDTTTPGLPIGLLFDSDHGMCVLAANAKLEVLGNVMQMAECIDEEIMFEDEFPDEECESRVKKQKPTPQTGKKRKPKV